MALAARESLDVAGRTERLARWVVLFARIVVGVAALILGLALVSLVVFLAQGRGSAVVTGAGSLAGVAVFLLVQAVFLALIGRYAQLRAADVRASRAYEAAVAAALADVLRTRDATPAPTAVATAVATDAPAAAPVVPDPIVTPAVVAAVAALETTTDVSDDQAAWHPHSHSAEAAAADSLAATSEPVLTVQAALAAEQATVQPAAAAEPVVEAPAVVATVVQTPVQTAAVAEAATATTEATVAESAVAVSPETGLPVAGWYPDPAGPGQRWWDGVQWTTATR